MSLLTRALVALLLAVSVTGALMGWRVRVLDRSLRAEQARAQVLEHTLTATRNSLSVYMTRAKETAARADRTQKELNSALRTHEGWRDMPVPDAVYSGLYDRRRRAPAAPGDAAR